MSGGKGVGGARSRCARTCLRVVVAAAVGAVLAEATGVKRAVASVVLVVVLVLRWGSALAAWWSQFAAGMSARGTNKHLVNAGGLEAARHEESAVGHALQVVLVQPVAHLVLLAHAAHPKRAEARHS